MVRKQPISTQEEQKLPEEIRKEPVISRKKVTKCWREIKSDPVTKREKTEIESRAAIFGETIQKTKESDRDE